MHVRERDDQGFQFQYYNFLTAPKLSKFDRNFTSFFLRILNMKYDFLKCLVLN